MRELRLLLRLRLLNLLRLNERRHTKDKKQRRRLTGMLVAYALVAPVMLLYASFLFYGLYAAGMSAGLPAIGAMLGGALALLVTVTRAQGILFDVGGWELLGALPFSRGQLALSKLLDLYAGALVASLAAMAPAGVFYLLGQGFGVLPLARLALITVLSPLLPVCLGIVLSALAAGVTGRFRHRHLLSGVVLLAALSLMMAALYTTPYQDMTTQDMVTAAANVTALMTRGWPPAAFAQRAAQGAALDMLLYALMGLVPMAALFAALRAHYPALRQFFGKTARGRARARQPGAKRPVMALTIKEVRRVISSPLYLFNTVLMAWLAPTVLALIGLMQPDLFGGIAALPEAAPLVKPLLPVAAALFAVAGNTTALSLSMEGKSAWLMATCPVKPRAVYFGKVLASFLLCAPSAALTALALGWLFKPGAATVLSCLVFSPTICALGAVIGLRIDCRFARYDWESERQIVKNSAQTLMMVAAQFVVLLAFGGAAWALRALGGFTGLALSLPAAGLAVVLWGRVKNMPIFIVQ